jgi:hypothetical protein
MQSVTVSKAAPDALQCPSGVSTHNAANAKHNQKRSTQCQLGLHVCDRHCMQHWLLYSARSLALLHSIRITYTACAARHNLQFEDFL